MAIPMIGIDPSLTCTGISDGLRHELIKTSPDNTLLAPHDIIRRTDIIINGIREFVKDTPRPFEIWMEAAMVTPGANHLFEVGALYTMIHRTFSGRLKDAFDGQAVIHEIAPTVLKKFFAGKGNAKKNHDPKQCPAKAVCMVCAARDNWGIEFKQDAGRDKLHAYALNRYGIAVAKGAIDHTPSKRRSTKKRKKSSSTDARSRRDSTRQRANRGRSKT